jgi:hypothetical protein
MARSLDCRRHHQRPLMVSDLSSVAPGVPRQCSARVHVFNHHGNPGAIGRNGEQANPPREPTVAGSP